MTRIPLSEDGGKDDLRRLCKVSGEISRLRYILALGNTEEKLEARMELIELGDITEEIDDDNQKG